jgi:hypothetical protein
MDYMSTQWRAERAAPADLTLVVNLRTAKVLGRDVPAARSARRRGDRVIRRREFE